MIPTEMLVIPWYLMSQQFGWLDTHWGIMFPGLMTAFGTFLMKQFFETVPDDFIEAARIDGLNELQIWWTVAMPLVQPRWPRWRSFVFLGNWTAFIWPLIVTNSLEMYTLARRSFDLRRRGRCGVGADHDRRRDLDDPDPDRFPGLPAFHHPRRRHGGAEGMNAAWELTRRDRPLAAPTRRRFGRHVTDRSVFPDPVYRDTVLAPLFEAVKEHYARHMMAINKAHLVMLAETGILNPEQAGKIANALARNRS